jgi:O-antigen/teichoic acid export membrane protein
MPVEDISEPMRSDEVVTPAVPLSVVTNSSWQERLVPTLRTLLGWSAKGGLAVTDQALFAGAQFALNILLARWLSPGGYGAFAVAYAVFGLASAVYSAILLEPMTVFGSGKHYEKRKSYLAILVRGHWLVTAPAGLLLFGAGLLEERLNSQPVGHALCGLGFALPLILFAWLTRWAFYIELRPGRAALGSALYFCLLLVFVSGLHAEQMLSPAYAILAMGAAAVLTAGFQLSSLHSLWAAKLGSLSFSSVAFEHWDYGRWSVSSAFAAWVSWNIYYFVLPLSIGLAAAGTLKALLNLATPATHSLVALGALLLPLVVRHRERGGLSLMRQTVRHVIAIFLAGALVYVAVLWTFRVQILKLLYGGKYLEHSGLPVLLVGLIPLATVFGVVLGSALRACLYPNRVFGGYLAAGITAVSVGVWFAFSWGVVGALTGYLASYATLAIILCIFYRRLCRQATSE